MSNESLMLHFGGNGPVEIEVWDKDTETATHVFSEYPDEKKSADLTDALQRAGYQLTPTIEEVSDE